MKFIYCDFECIFSTAMGWIVVKSCTYCTLSFPSAPIVIIMVTIRLYLFTYYTYFFLEGTLLTSNEAKLRINRSIMTHIVCQCLPKLLQMAHAKIIKLSLLWSAASMFYISWVQRKIYVQVKRNQHRLLIGNTENPQPVHVKVGLSVPNKRNAQKVNNGSFSVGQYKLWTSLYGLC